MTCPVNVRSTGRAVADGSRFQSDGVATRSTTVITRCKKRPPPESRVRVNRMEWVSPEPHPYTNRLWRKRGLLRRFSPATMPQRSQPTSTAEPGRGLKHNWPRLNSAASPITPDRLVKWTRSVGCFRFLASTNNTPSPDPFIFGQLSCSRRDDAASAKRIHRRFSSTRGRPLSRHGT